MSMLSTGGAPSELRVYRLGIDNDASVDAEDVRFRVMSVEPPGAAEDLPFDLTWAGTGDPKTTLKSNAFSRVGTSTQSYAFSLGLMTVATGQ